MSMNLCIECDCQIDKEDDEVYIEGLCDKCCDQKLQEDSRFSIDIPCEDLDS